jgi:hypothetical protein
MRYSDYGYVRSVTSVVGGKEVALARVAKATGRIEGPVATYLIPREVLDFFREHPPTVGKLTEIGSTDGRTVNSFTVH